MPGSYSVTCHRIKSAAEYFGYPFGENRAKEFLTYYIDNGLIRKVGKTYALTLADEEPGTAVPGTAGMDSPSDADEGFTDSAMLTTGLV